MPCYFFRTLLFVLRKSKPKYRRVIEWCAMKRNKRKCLPKFVTIIFLSMCYMYVAQVINACACDDFFGTTLVQIAKYIHNARLRFSSSLYLTNIIFTELAKPTNSASSRSLVDHMTDSDVKLSNDRPRESRTWSTRFNCWLFRTWI